MSQKNNIISYDSHFSFMDFITFASNTFKEAPAFTIHNHNKSKNISFIEFNDNIKELQLGLRNIGITHNKVGIISFNCYEWFCSLLSIATSNNIAFLINPSLTSIELEKIINYNKLDVIIFDKNILPIIKKILSNTSVKYSICIGLNKKSNNILSYSNLLLKGKSALHKAIIYDTTKTYNYNNIYISTIKGNTNICNIILSQRNICSNIIAFNSINNINSVYIALSFNDITAYITYFLYCYHSGININISTKEHIKIENILYCNSNGLICSSSVLNKLYLVLKSELKNNFKYFSLMCIISNIFMFLNIDIRKKIFINVLHNIDCYFNTIIYCSSAIDKNIIKFFNNIGINLILGYGLIETLPTITFESNKLQHLVSSIMSTIHSINKTHYIKNFHLIYNKFNRNYINTITSLQFSVEEKDKYTRGHSDRVSAYSVLIGKKLHLNKNTLQILKIGGLFHDIGKICIPDNILLKTSKLTDEEYNQIRNHPQIGVDILKESTIFKDIIPIVKYHHERFDGHGYPSQLSGNDIPLIARITTVADTFDAMTSTRTYRSALPLDVVISEIEKCSGTQFDPEIASAFLDILKNDYPSIEKIQKNTYNKII